MLERGQVLVTIPVWLNTDSAMVQLLAIARLAGNSLRSLSFIKPSLDKKGSLRLHAPDSSRTFKQYWPAYRIRYTVLASCVCVRFLGRLVVDLTRPL